LQQKMAITRESAVIILAHRIAAIMIRKIGE